jgi:hypothetical protein
MALSDTVNRARDAISEAPTGVIQAKDFGPIDRERILQLIGLNPRDPKAHAVIAVAERYQLDPVLGHIAIIAQSRTPYITRDGFLFIAHRSGHLDGIEIVDGPRREGAEWVCRVAVYRDDMRHAFTYPGRAEFGRDNGPEMAIARAERRALRRAFAVTLPAMFGDEDGAGIERASEPPREALSAPQNDEPPQGEATPPDWPRDISGDPYAIPPSRIGPNLDAGGVVDVPLPGDQLPERPSFAARMISRPQQIALLTAFRDLGMNDRDARMRETINIIGRDISSSSELSRDEATLVIDTLTDIRNTLDSDNASSQSTNERGEDNGTEAGNLPNT